MRSTIVGTVLLIALIFAATIWALVLFQGAGMMIPEEVLPPDTQLVVHVPDVPKLVRKLSHATAGSDPAEARWNLMADALERLLLSRGVTMSPSSADLERLMSGEAIAALLPDGDGGSALVLILEIGHGSEETIERARRHLEETPASAGGLWSVRRHRGLDYATWRPADGGILCVTGLRGLAILATSVESMRKVLDTMDGDREPLGSTPSYRSIRSRIDGDAPLLIYASGKQLRRSLDAILSRPGERLPGNLAYLIGLDAMTGAGLSVDVTGGLFEERLFVAMEEEGRGILGELFAASPRKPRLSRLAPSGMPFTISLSLTSLDAVMREIPAIVGGASREERREVRDRIAGLEGFLALHLERDVFGTLGDSMVVSWEPPWRSDDSPDRGWKATLLRSRAVASISVRRRDGLRSLLDRVDGLARAMAVYSVIDLEGHAAAAYRFESLRPMTPAYALLDDHLLAATSPDLLAGALTASSSQSSLADDKEARRLLRSLPGKVHLLLIASAESLSRWAGNAGGSPFIAGALPVETGDHPVGDRVALACKLGRAGLLVESVAPTRPFLMTLARFDGARAGDRKPVRRPQGRSRDSY